MTELENKKILNEVEEAKVSGAGDINSNHEFPEANTTFTGNNPEQGGVIYSNPDVPVQNTAFTGNRAEHGGEIYSQT